MLVWGRDSDCCLHDFVPVVLITKCWLMHAMSINGIYIFWGFYFVFILCSGMFYFAWFVLLAVTLNLDRLLKILYYIFLDLTFSKKVDFEYEYQLYPDF